MLMNNIEQRIICCLFSLLILDARTICPVVNEIVQCLRNQPVMIYLCDQTTYLPYVIHDYNTLADC